ncbi:MAG TPA: MFS transporter [Bacillales bacterium]|nr:MFS transporter [Bacillales bacterium]
MQNQSIETKASEQKDRKWWSLIAVCFGLFMALLDVTIVNVALPTIQTDLKADFSSLEWVINAYTLVFAVALVTMSRLGDIFGRKTMFIFGLSIFTFGSLLCALSGDFQIAGLSHITELNISRGIQGLGGSAMMPLSLAIISATFTGKQRGVAIGVWGGISGLATAIGPLIGGLLVERINWQSIFLLNVPIGIVGIFMALWAIKQSRDESAARKVDLFGFFTFTVFVFCLIYGFIQVNDPDKGWTSPYILTLFAISCVALIVFIVGELRIKTPMVDPRLFKIPSFTGSAIAGFCLSAGLYALLFYLSLYLQNFLDFGALAAGLRFLPLSVLSFVIGPIAGTLMGRTGPKWLVVVALALLTVAVWLMSAISPSNEAADWVVLLPGLIIGGIGNGLINPPISNLAVGTVDRRRAGMASGVNSVCRQIGIAFGTAFLGAILASRYTKLITDKIQAMHAANLPDSVKQKIIEGVAKAGPIAGSNGLKQAPDAYQKMPLFHQIQEAAQAAFVTATSDIIQVASVFLAVGTILSIFLIRQKDLHH